MARRRALPYLLIAVLLAGLAVKEVSDLGGSAEGPNASDESLGYAATTSELEASFRNELDRDYEGADLDARPASTSCDIPREPGSGTASKVWTCDARIDYFDLNTQRREHLGDERWEVRIAARCWSAKLTQSRTIVSGQQFGPARGDRRLTGCAE